MCLLKVHPSGRIGDSSMPVVLKQSPEGKMPGNIPGIFLAKELNGAFWVGRHYWS